MMDQRRRRWSIIKPALGQRLVSAACFRRASVLCFVGYIAGRAGHTVSLRNIGSQLDLPSQIIVLRGDVCLCI